MGSMLQTTFCQNGINMYGLNSFLQSRARRSITLVKTVEQDQDA